MPELGGVGPVDRRMLGLRRRNRKQALVLEKKAADDTQGSSGLRRRKRKQALVSEKKAADETQAKGLVLLLLLLLLMLLLVLVLILKTRTAMYTAVQLPFTCASSACGLECDRSAAGRKNASDCCSRPVVVCREAARAGW